MPNTSAIWQNKATIPPTKIHLLTPKYMTRKWEPRSQCRKGGLEKIQVIGLEGRKKERIEKVSIR